MLELQREHYEHLFQHHHLTKEDRFWSLSQVGLVVRIGRQQNRYWNAGVLKSRDIF